jgi:putative hydrolase of the HAD superfamily
MLSWLDNRITAEELWVVWLTSPAVRSFEKGQSGPDEFADHLIKELALPVDKEEFLNEFAHWPKRLFPGALELVHRVSPPYIRATLCNTNVLHWRRLMNDMGLADVFERHFASHLVGKIKPDEDAFEHVIATLGCKAAEVLFLDDNALNVEAAKRIGMRTARVKGVIEAEQALLEAGIIS